MSDPTGSAPTDDLASRGTAQSAALGIQTIEGACAMRAPFRADLVDDPERGGLANGVITTLLDQTCGMAVSMARRDGAPGDAAFQRFGAMATLDLRIDFVRPAKPGREVVGQAECYRIVGGVGFVRGLAFEDDPTDPIAAVQAAFMLTESAGRRMSEVTVAKLDAFLAARPYARFLGVQAQSDGAAVRTILPFSPHLVGNPLIPALHGGVVGGFLELAALAHLAATSPDGVMPRTVDVTIDYLRPARAVTTYADVQVVRRGRRVANVSVTAWQSSPGAPVTTLRGHFLVGC